MSRRRPSQGSSDGGLQPRSDADARRYPARDDRCREIRAMLRDHADGDLGDDLRNAVDEHLHGCRECGLALSRAELEVMRLKEAFREPEVDRIGPSQEFTAVVMARIHAEQRRARKNRPAAGFTKKVMSQVRLESRSHRRGRLLRRVLLPAALLLLGALLVVMNLPGGDATYISVATAEEAWLSTDGGETSLLGGTELPRQAKLRTGAQGCVELVLPALAGRGAGSRLRLESESELFLADLHETGKMHLSAGRMTVSSGGVLDVFLADGTKVVLEKGDFGLDARQYYPFDRALFDGPTLRVRLVVSKGRAQIWRGGEAVEVVTGEVARFTTRTPVRRDRAITAELIHTSARNAQDLADEWNRRNQSRNRPEDGPWLGRLLDPISRQPVAGASLRLVTHLGPQTVKTDSAGRFRLPELPNPQGQFAVVEATANSPQGLLKFGPVVLPLNAAVQRETPRELLMVRERRLVGELRDQDNRPVLDARLLPALVDEALGLVQPLPDLAVDVDGGGRFALRGLPAVLPAQTSLVLVALSNERAPQICFSSQGRRGVADNRDLALRLRISSPAAQRLVLPAGKKLQILQTVRGLPPYRLLARRLVTSDSLGQVQLSQSAGTELWLLREERPPVALRASADGSLRPQSNLVVPGAVRHLRAGDEMQPARYALGAGQPHRFATLAEVPRGPQAGRLSVQRVGSQVDAGAGAQLFQQDVTSGTYMFLGTYDGNRPLPYTVPAGARRLLAVDADGGLGHLDLSDQPRIFQQVSLLVPRPLVLSPGLLQRARAAGGILYLRRTGVGGDLFLTRQLQADEDGELQLLPGSYEVGFGSGESITVQHR